MGVKASVGASVGVSVGRNGKVKAMDGHPNVCECLGGVNAHAEMNVR